MPKILFRHKKKEFEGFKTYVQDLEITPLQQMLPRFQMAALEDPVYMSWVAKNIIDIDKFLGLGEAEIELILNSIKDALPILASAFSETREDALIRPLLRANLLEKYDYECTLHIDVPLGRRENARFSLYKAFRSLQNQGIVQGHPWRLPPLDVVRNPKTPPNANDTFELFFDGDTHTLALRGDLYKGFREGVWEHYYTTGKLMAKGEYHEGEYSGAWTFFYPSGQKKSEGYFEKGKKTGTWTEWDRIGSAKTISYDSSTLEDEEEEGH